MSLRLALAINRWNLRIEMLIGSQFLKESRNGGWEGRLRVIEQNRAEYRVVYINSEVNA